VMLSFNNFFPANVVAFVSDRKVNFSLDKNNPVLTTVQQEYLSTNLGKWQVDLTKLSTIVQVHGNRILVRKDNSGQDIKEADGLITNLKNLPLTVRTADCCSIFLYAPNNCIGLVHAGWRGTRKRIVQEAIKMMQQEYEVSPAQMKAALGPAIRKCCYQVSEEFKDYFPRAVFFREGKYFLDLSLENVEQLTQMGLRQENIFDCGICTCCDINYFSYRREGQAAGRMISFMMMT